MLELNKVYNMDCIEGMKLLDDKSVDCCITSPPYWGLRDYGVEGQIGLEESLGEYINKMVEVFREVRRVLKDEGTLWLNLGDSYVGNGGNRNYKESNKHFDEMAKRNPQSGRYDKIRQLKERGLKPKQLMGIPWRVAFALQDDGWYLRSDIIWHKPNCMPESVKDRPTRCHEYIFLMSKSHKYYYDHEIIKEAAVNGDPGSPRGSKGVLGNKHKGNRKTFRGGGKYTQGQSHENTELVDLAVKGNKPNKTMKRNKRDVWTVSTSQFKQAHFATFPGKLIEPCILAGCPEKGVILEPFAGSGTTVVESYKWNRNSIAFELNTGYCKMSNDRMFEVSRQQRIEI